MAGIQMSAGEVSRHIFKHTHQMIGKICEHVDQAAEHIDRHDYQGTLDALAEVPEQISHIVTMMLVLRDFVIKPD